MSTFGGAAFAGDDAISGELPQRLGTTETKIHQGADGLVVIESESTQSDLGLWVARKTCDGFTGAGHLEFTGNRAAGGSPLSPLTYLLTVDRDGVYGLTIRGHKQLVGDNGKKSRGDHCNDCYVRLEGDYEAAGVIPKTVLSQDTKVYIQGRDIVSWGWTKNLDFRDPEDRKHKRRVPLYNLKANEVYKMTISGRSQRFNMDRIVLYHESVDVEEATNPQAEASETVRRPTK